MARLSICADAIVQPIAAEDHFMDICCTDLTYDAAAREVLETGGRLEDTDY
jgi:hypothetical protein